MLSETRQQPPHPIDSATAGPRRPRPFTLLAAALVMTLAGAGLAAQTRPIPDTFTATTEGMTPSGATIKLDVLTWSDEDARAAVVERLTAPPAADEDGGDAEVVGEEEDGEEAEDAEDVEDEAPPSLSDLPTAGYVWVDDGAVGYTIKYAERTAESGGGERITIVTDRVLGSYDYTPWSADGVEEDASYSVIELYLDADGRGTGTLSLVAEVSIDAAASSVSLEGGATAKAVLTDAQALPKPYWAQGG